MNIMSSGLRWMSSGEPSPVVQIASKLSAKSQPSPTSMKVVTLVRRSRMALMLSRNSRP